MTDKHFIQSKDSFGYNTELGDTPKSFEAFIIYRDMGASRTLPAVAKKINRTLAAVQQWSSKCQWHERAINWDAHIDTIARDNALKISINSHVDKLKRYRVFHEGLGWAALTTAEQCLEIARNALSRYVENPDLELRPVDIKLIATTGVSLSEIGSRLLSDSLAVERLLEQLPVDESVEVDSVGVD